MDGSIGMPSVFDAGEMWGMAVWENKGGESSTHTGLRQGGAGYGFPIAKALRGLGFDAKDILVPVVLCNGIQIQFACVYMLQESFPVYSLVSAPFSLSLRYYSELKKAAAFVLKVKKIAHANNDRVKALTSNVKGRIDLSKLEMLLDLGLYHLKEIGVNFPMRGFDVNYGCSQMLDRLGFMSSRLDDQDMKLIVFPLAIRAGDNGKLPHLVFDKIDREGYEGGPFTVGLPNPNTDLWGKCLFAVERAFHIIHNKGGVVHVDPFPSNTMWRQVNDGADVEVKIIDWDGVHVDGEHWASDIMRRVKKLASNRRTLGWVFTEKASILHDLQYLRVLRGLDVSNIEHTLICQDLASGDVGKINDAFRSAAAIIDIGKIGNNHLLGYKP